MQGLKAFSRVVNRYFIYVIIAVLIGNLAHTYLLLPHPFIGQNGWRDAQTFGVARNYLEEDRPFLQPSYDIRSSSDGRLPGEFPLQSYYASCFMKVFGRTLCMARMSNFVLGLCSVILLFLVLCHVFGKDAAWLGTALFSSNALAASQMVSVMPETMVNFLSILAVFSYLKIRHLWVKWTAVIALVSLCTLVKPSGFVIVVFLITYDFFTNGLVGKQRLAYLFLVLVPVLGLKWWIGYTLQFESTTFTPITHHYNHSIKDALHDFNLEVIVTAFEKTFRHAFNVLGVLGLVFVCISLAKKSTQMGSNDKGWLYGLTFWLAGGIAFLFYAGQIQVEQLYYASPLIIPCVLIVSDSLVRFEMLKWLVLLVLFLQTNIKINTFNENYFGSRSTWETMEMEKITDQFSSREDLFIIYPYHFPNFLMLGRLGRRGYNLQSESELQLHFKKFRYLCLSDTLKRSEVLPYVMNDSRIKYNGVEFYALKNNR